MPAKRRKWTDEERKLVRMMALAAIPQEDIARTIHTTAETLEKYFRTELDEGGNKATGAVAAALFKNALSGNVTAQIFWMKTRARWKETSALEVTGEDGTPLVPILEINYEGRKVKT